jgi:polygalacturonase
MTVNIKDMGAKGEGAFLNTEAIQKAIDLCSQSGGGTVLIEDGVYITGKIIMKDNVNLHIDVTATLKASENTDDFPQSSDEEASHVNTQRLTRWSNNCVIFANECKNISITGKGTIDFNGDAFVELRDKDDPCGLVYKQKSLKGPARGFFFTGCENVNVEDINAINAPAGWTFWIHDCDFVHFAKCNIISNLNYPNTDGIHINCSRNVTISDCNISVGDDCIIVRANSASLKENKPSEKVVVTNCNLTSYANAIRLGWINDGVIKNCAFSNLVITDTSYGIGISLPTLKIKEGDFLGADVGREATLVENITFNNIIMDKITRYPVDINIGDGQQSVDAVRNIYISNLHSKSMEMPRVIGRKQNIIENIRFSDCTFAVYDGKDIENLTTHGYGFVKERPEPKLDIRFTKNVSFNNTVFDCEI